MLTALQALTIRNLNKTTSRNIQRTRDTTDRIIEQRNSSALETRLDELGIAHQVQIASTHSAVEVLRTAVQQIADLTGEPAAAIEARFMVEREGRFDAVIETMMKEGALKNDPRTAKYVGHFKWYKKLSTPATPRP